MTIKASSDPLIGALLRRPFTVMRQQIHAELVERGFADVHPAHLSVFQHPGPEGRRPIELAEAAQMTKQAMNHLLGQLTDLGLLVREPMKRGARVRLTPEGRAVLRAIREAVLRIEERWRTAMGAARYAQLHDRLLELNAVIAGPEAGPAVGE